jgi:hypothetical protein
MGNRDKKIDRAGPEKQPGILRPDMQPFLREYRRRKEGTGNDQSVVGEIFKGTPE